MIKAMIRKARAVRPAQWAASACVASALALCALPVRTGRSTAELWLCILIPAVAAVGATFCVCRKATVKFSLIDAIALMWYAYSMTLIWLRPEYPAFGHAAGATLACGLYLSMRMLFCGCAPTGRSICLLVICLALLEAYMGYAQLISGASRHGMYPVTGSFLNPGPYSACLALGAVTLCAMRRDPGPAALAALVFLLAPLALTVSRAAFLSTGVCMLILYKDKIGGPKRWALLLSAAAVIAAGLYLVKSGSADGRWVIDHVGLRCMLRNPLTGSGAGGFFHLYAQETARMSMSGHAASLTSADVLEYAFNDLLRVGVEQGLIGLALAAGLISAVLWRLWHKSVPLCLGVLSLVIFSFFSYPFELLPYRIVGAVIAAYAATDATATAVAKRFPAALRQGFAVAMIGALAVVSHNGIADRLRAEKEYNMLSGLHDKAFTKDYRELLPLLDDNKRFLFDYAKLLAEQGRYNDSNAMLRLGSLLTNDPMMLVLQGNNYRDMGMVDEAEEMYTRAWHTMPNRIYPLYRLMTLHLQQGNAAKATEYARRVADFKEKVSSPAVREMKREAEQVISNSE